MLYVTSTSTPEPSKHFRGDRNTRPPKLRFRGSLFFTYPKHTANIQIPDEFVHSCFVFFCLTKPLSKMLLYTVVYDLSSVRTVPRVHNASAVLLIARERYTRAREGRSPFGLRFFCQLWLPLPSAVCCSKTEPLFLSFDFIVSLVSSFPLRLISSFPCLPSNLLRSSR